MNDKINITSIVLAAGQSSRMGTIKQLLPWKDNSLINHCITQSINSKVSNTIVVLGAFKEQIIESIFNIPDIDIVENREWEKGMMSSINVGLKSCNKDTNAILILLADQPSIDSDYINNMIQLYQNNQKSIIATEYKNTLGVPAIIDKSYFKQLKKSKLEKQGAKFLIESNLHDVISIKPTFELFDLDTIEDYKNYRDHK